MGEIHELLVLALSLVWFAGATPDTCRKILGESIFARMHAGPVFALARIKEIIFEESWSEYFSQILGEFALVQIHAATVVAPARAQGTSAGE